MRVHLNDILDPLLCMFHPNWWKRVLASAPSIMIKKQVLDVAKCTLLALHE
jgi:hypothetical protein